MVAFLACAVFGAVLLVAQLVAGGDAHADGGDAAPSDAAPSHPTSGVEHHGLALFALRPLAAGVAFFGLGGAAARASGWSTGAALGAALVAGVAAAVATAALLRALLRFESDGTVRLAGAVGTEATVYVPIPARGAGKVQLVLQGRLVECSATAADDGSYATGARVLVADVAPDGGLLVAADPAAPDARGASSNPRSLPT